MATPYNSVHTGGQVDAAVSEVANIAAIRQAVEDDRILAQSAAGNANTDADDADIAKEAAELAAFNAEQAKDLAVTKAGEAGGSATTAGLAKDDAETARDLAQSYRNQAKAYRDSAAEVAAGNVINDGEVSEHLTYSSDKIESLISASGAATSSIIASAGASLTLTGASVRLFHITLDESLCELSVSIPTVAPDMRVITLLLKQGTGANLIDWNANIIWQNGRPPVLSYEQDVVDIVRIISDPLQSGRWYGIFDGAWFE